LGLASRTTMMIPKETASVHDPLVVAVTAV
jgi:hypothetical protein